MNILVGIDLSESTEKVINKAEEIARAFASKLWMVHVADPDPDFVGYTVGPQSVRDSIAKKFHKEHRQLQDIAERLRQHDIDASALLVQGPTVKMILKEASKLGADIIVLGSHGRGAMYHLLVGSVSEGVLQKAECPVLIVPTHKRT